MGLDPQLPGSLLHGIYNIQGSHGGENVRQIGAGCAAGTYSSVYNHRFTDLNAIPARTAGAYADKGGRAHPGQLFHGDGGGGYADRNTLIGTGEYGVLPVDADQACIRQPLRNALGTLGISRN